MKHLAFFLSICFISMSCEFASTGSDVRQFIPGTYIRSSQHEFGLENDTLIILPQNEMANEYKIIRRWKYARVLDGQKMEPKYEQRQTMAVFDKKESRLVEAPSGDTYSFDPYKKVLFNGTVKYHKQ